MTCLWSNVAIDTDGQAVVRSPNTVVDGTITLVSDELHMATTHHVGGLDASVSETTNMLRFRYVPPKRPLAGQQASQ